MPQFRGPVEKDEFVDRASSRGLSVEQVRKRFIRYKDVNESPFFAPQDITAVAVITHMILALQAVNKSATI